jgi:signal transduction histidine kinase
MATVLIISGDPEFSSALVSRWRQERNVPEFTVLDSVVWNGAGPGAYDLAIAGPPAPGNDPESLTQAERFVRGVVTSLGPGPILVADARLSVLEAAKRAEPRALTLQTQGAWTENLVVLASEVLRRVEANARARRAEQAAALAQRQATLGRYMLDMRHAINNALTSVLGNAELLLFEPGNLSTEVREQISTMYSMTLRMHDIVQRFSALESEMIFSEKRSHSEKNLGGFDGSMATHSTTESH